MALERLAVIWGSGDWLRRIGPGMKQFGLKPMYIVGSSELEVGQQRIATYGVSGQYVTHEQVADLSMPEQGVGVVISRSDQHGRDAEVAYGLGLEAVLVEKPFGQTGEEARSIATIWTDRFRFSSDHYGFKGIVLEVLAGMRRSEYVQATDPGRRSLESMIGSVEAIGRIERVEGRLVERKGIAGREWLRDPRQGGGVLLDLMVHQLFLTARFGLLDEKCVVKSVVAETKDSQTGLWRQVDQFGTDPMAEMLAAVSYETGTGVPVNIVVGKVDAERLVTGGKELVMTGEHGVARLNLAGAYGQVDIEDWRRREKWGAIMNLEAYEAVSEQFVAALRGEAPDNVAESTAAVEMTDRFKEVHNENVAMARSVSYRLYADSMVVAA